MILNTIVIRLNSGDTEQLFSIVTDMSDRIRQLEDALRHECNLRPGETHPLLKDELLSIEEGSSRVASSSEQAQDGFSLDVDASDEEADLTDALGLLSLSEGSSSHFLGASGSEVRGDLKDIQIIFVEKLQLECFVGGKIRPASNRYLQFELSY